MKIYIVAGARPNFMKIAPIVRSFQKIKNKSIKYKIIHTGQHYDEEMSESFFSELLIPKPDVYLNAGSGTHAQQTSKIMIEFEKICTAEKPDLVLVVGDVNSTLACSVVAKKMCIKVAHVEAGLRSNDMSMPEEINRIVTDSITDYFFVTEESGIENLLREGKDKGLIYFVGHVMIDNLLFQKQKLDQDKNQNFPTSKLKNELKEYIFLTLHRPSNVDDQSILKGIADALNNISSQIDIVFPVHPRTRKMLDQYNIQFSKNIHCLNPLGFTESLFLWKDSKIVFTDSGGLQEETTALGIPCFTLRNNTERPITIKEGTNRLVGNKKAGIISAWKEFSQVKDKRNCRVPNRWDGHAAERITNILLNIQK